MSHYRFTYRNMSGQVNTVVLVASNESEARNAFYAKYDGRIITVEVF